MKKKLTNILKVIFLIIIAVILLFFLIRSIISHNTLKNSTSKNKVSELQQIKLQNKMQTVLLEEKSKDLPILITVHGGPGTPIPFSIGARNAFPELTDKYIMVYWDQYGCGKNYSPLNNEITIENYVNMLADLVMEIRKQYPDNKIYLLGMSWGSILTCKVSNRLPDIISGVIVYGQIVNNLGKNEDAYNQLIRCNLKKEERQVLDQVMKSDNCDFESRLEVYSLIGKYTNGYFYKDKGESNSKIYKLILGMFFSPDYTLTDAYNSLIGGNKNVQMNSNLLKEMFNTDLSKELSNVKIPYLILQGKEDTIASTSTVETLASHSNNPNLKVKVLEKSGHIPTNNCFKKIIDTVINYQTK